jgi:hypothetical protein
MSFLVVPAVSIVARPAASLLTYLWHYTLARLLYDHHVRPLGLGALAVALLAVAVLMRTRRGRR